MVLTKKILFRLDVLGIHFGIAKHLNEEYGQKIFAIIDVNQGKSFYENQTLVNFEKQWFFRDHLKNINKNPDLDYLKNIESKYNINLWNLAYSDRNFYKFNPFYKFSRDEILSLTEQECKFFERVLDEIKPDFLAMRMSDFHRNDLLMKICKARKIKPIT